LIYKTHCDGRNKNRRESAIAKYLHRYLVFFHRQKSWTQKKLSGQIRPARDPVTLKKRGGGKEKRAARDNGRELTIRQHFAHRTNAKGKQLFWRIAFSLNDIFFSFNRLIHPSRCNSFLRARKGQRFPRVRNGSGELAQAAMRARNPLSRTLQCYPRHFSIFDTHTIMSFLSVPSVFFTMPWARPFPPPAPPLVLTPPLLPPTHFVNEP